MSATIYAFPLAHDRSVGQMLRDAFPVKSAPDDMLDLFDACRAALDGITSGEQLDRLNSLLDTIAG